MSTGPARRVPPAAKIGLLSALYFVQGLPFGFQANALSLYLTGVGVSPELVGLSRGLALPWMLKAFWAPLVDRYGHAGFGRRKTWIVPLQAALALTCVGAAFLPPETHLTGLLAAVLLMNLFTATQDIAVDGLAVDLLQPAELGAGNAAQVVGYKVGMLTGGGLLVALSASIGWKGLFFTMAGLCLVVMGVLIPMREPVGPGAPATGGAHDSAGQGGVGRAELWARLKSIVTAPGAGPLLVVIATYKVGETMADAMFGPCLVQRFHIEKETVALWLGSWGMVGSLLGSLFGGLLATRTTLLRALTVAAVLRSIPLFGQWAIAAGLWAAGPHSVVPVTVAEHFFGGILTTSMFAFMMSKVDRRIGATHYTVLASVEVLGKAPSGLLSGFGVRWLGYDGLFLLAAAVSLGFVLLLVPLRKHHTPGGDAPPAPVP